MPVKSLLNEVSQLFLTRLKLNFGVNLILSNIELFIC